MPISAARTRATLAAVAPADPAPPFYVDQGALQIDEHADLARLLGAVPAMAALSTAAEQGLHIPQDTLQRLQRIAPQFSELPRELGGELLFNLVGGERPAAKVDAVTRAGLLRRILPEVEHLRTMPRGNRLYKDVYVHTLRVLDATPADPITRLSALLHDVAKPDTLTTDGGVARFPNHDLIGSEMVGRRLRSLGFDAGVANAIKTLVRLHLRANSYEPTWTDSAVRRLKLDAGDQWERLLALSDADVTSARPEVVARAHRRVQELAAHAQALERHATASPLDGVALMERFGRGPGRWIGAVKDHLVALVQSGELPENDLDGAWEAAAACLRRLDQEEAAH